MNKSASQKAKKIHIMGISGSGKSYLANRLSEQTGIKKYGLDDIFWRKKYTAQRSEEEKVELLSQIIRNGSWIVEGVFTSFVSESLKNADLVIWIDENMNLVSFRIFRRAFIREIKEKKYIGLSWLRETFDLVKFARRYKDDDGMYYKYQQMLKEHNISPIVLTGKGEVNRFIADH